MYFRKKPIVIEAIEWDGHATTANRFIGERYGTDWRFAAEPDLAILIPTLEGEMRGEVGDWIIKGVRGEFYPCKADIFAATYEPAGKVGGVNEKPIGGRPAAPPAPPLPIR